MILAQALSTLLVFTTPIFAGSAMAEPTAKQYQIPPGSLKDALAQFGREAQVMLSYNSELVSGLHSNGLNKTASVRDGLEQLLTGTGLEAVAQENGGYMLRKSNKPATGSSESTLDEVRVSASKDPTTENTGSYTTSSTGASVKLPLSLRHTPQSISVITRQRMDDQNLTQLQEVLEQTVGITVTQSGYVGANWNGYQSRGFNIDNYLVDGLPQRNGFEQMTSDMAFYDRVEILRGANGIVNGVGSPGGSINFIRKKPTKEFQASVTGQAGSWDNYRGMLDISTPLNADGSVRTRVVGVKQDSRSYTERFSLEREMFYGIIEAEITPSTLFTAGVEYQKYDTNASPEAGFPLFFSDGSHTQWKRSKNPGTNWAYSKHEKLAWFTSLEHFFDNDWRAKLQFNRSRIEYDSLIGSAFWGYPDRNTGAGVNLYAGRWQAKPVQNALDVYASGPFSLLGRQHDLVFGINASDSEYNSPSNDLWNIAGYDPSVPNLIDWDGNSPAAPYLPTTGRYKFRERQFGAYVTAKFKPTDKLAILAGARVSHWHQTTEQTPDPKESKSETGEVTPYLAVTYDVTDTASVYGSYTTIFSPQSYQSPNGTFLPPLEGKSMETGIKHAFYDGRLNTSLAVFYVEQDNVPVELPGVPGPRGGASYRAEKGTTSKGFEAEVAGELQPGWQVSGGYTYRISKDADGHLLQTVAPKNLVKLFTSYRLRGDWNKLTLGGGVNWQSRIYTDDTGPGGAYRFTQGSYAVVNLLARYQFDEHLSAALNVNNLLDKTYYTSTNMGFYGAPSNAMLTVKYQF
ncbi:TonB-dependent siderophore receptor [Methylobacillus pratensis]